MLSFFTTIIGCYEINVFMMDYSIYMKRLGEIEHVTLAMKNIDNHCQIVTYVQRDKSLSGVEHRYESVGLHFILRH